MTTLSLAAIEMKDNYAPPAADLNLKAARLKGGYPSISSPRGRIGRVQLLAYGVLLHFVVGVCWFLAGIATVSNGGSANPFRDGPMIAATVAAALVIVVMWFIWSIKRCHDFERSGWLSLASLVPFVGLALFVIPGTQGGNDYGFKGPNRWDHWLIGPGLFALSVIAIVYRLA